MYVNSCSLQLRPELQRDPPQNGLFSLISFESLDSNLTFSISISFSVSISTSATSAHFIVVSTVCDLSRCSIKINMQICTTVGFGYIAKTSDYRLTSVTLIKAQKRKSYYIYFLIIVNSLLQVAGERSGIVGRTKEKPALEYQQSDWQ